jgi:hypothetical protein
MYDIFNPEIPGLEPPNPGIEKHVRDPGIRADPGIGIPTTNPPSTEVTESYSSLLPPKIIKRAGRLLEVAIVDILRYSSLLKIRWYFYIAMKH